MGFPVIESTIAAGCGALAQFARGLPAPATRNVRTQRRQAGNSMHVNVMGAFQFILYAKFPAVGGLIGGCQHERPSTDIDPVAADSADHEDVRGAISEPRTNVEPLMPTPPSVGFMLRSVVHCAPDFFDASAFKFARGTGGARVYGLAKGHRHVV